MTELYEDLPSFAEFSQLSNAAFYARLPTDWSIIIAYVVDAETTNNYRQVNSLGGGCITAVKNALKEEKNGAQVPYVFTGAGASFAVPPCCYDLTVGSLLSFRKIVRQNFKSDLCIGSITVKEIEEEGKKVVEVARYEISHGVCIALFRGGGMAYAATQVGCVLKGHTISEEDAAAMPNPVTQVNLEGLSCRWTPMPNKYGTILSILVYENPDRPNGQTYIDILHELDCILDFDRSNPTHMDSTNYKPFGQIWRDERRFGIWHCTLAYVLQLCLSIVIFRWGMMKTLLFDSEAAKAPLRYHSDFRKFDDMLRMVVDCTPDQAKAIEFVLQDRFNQGHLFYGIFSSSHAVMTCIMEGMADGEHIHFMDGADGGYTLAGKALREQMAEAAKKSANRPLENTGWSAPSASSASEEFGMRIGDGTDEKSSSPVATTEDTFSDFSGFGSFGGPSTNMTPFSTGVDTLDSMNDHGAPLQFDPVNHGAPLQFDPVQEEDDEENQLFGDDNTDPTERYQDEDEDEDGDPISSRKKSSKEKKSKKKKKKKSKHRADSEDGTLDLESGGSTKVERKKSKKSKKASKASKRETTLHAQ